jgi:sulfate permease, SulP family
MTQLTRPGELTHGSASIDFLVETQAVAARTSTTVKPDFDLTDVPIPSSHASPAAAKNSEPLAPVAAGEARKSSWIADALDGSVTTIPITLVGVALAYAALPAQYLGPGILATLLSLVLVHCVSAGTGRPIVLSTRLFEATTLGAMMLSFKVSSVSWGIELTDAHWLALLCSVSATAGVLSAVLYLLRADRYTRLIPAPVYAGFAISIAVLLFISQSRTLYKLWQQGSTLLSLLVIGLFAAATALLIRRYKPRWPPTATGIAVGAIVGLAWMWLTGQSVITVMSAAQSMQLPWQIADFQGLWTQSTQRSVMLKDVMGSGALLGLMLFINHTVACESISQVDDRYASRWGQAGMSLAVGVGGLLGAAPVAASLQAAAAACRHSPISGRKCLLIALVCLVTAGLGLLNWVALAAVAAVMLVDAYFFADKLALKQAWAWMRGLPLSRSQKEDLALVAVVTVASVLFNVVLAVFLGLFLGLVMFGMRNARKPVRYIWTGAQIHSNCARGRGELAVLAGHGERIKIVELEGELFFGSVSSLDASLQQSLSGAHSVILDWSRVRHIDSSIALSLARWQRMAAADAVRTLHAGVGLLAGNAPDFMRQYFPQAQHYPDLDRALEVAETSIITSYGVSKTNETTQLVDALHLFQGLSDKEREKLEQRMPQRLYKKGDTIFQAGDPSDHLLIVLQGSAGVVVPAGQGRDIRITSVRRGGVLGEIGFLDKAPRSAQVKAQDDVMAAILTRETFEQLRQDEPQIVMRLLTNLTLDLATRLRHTNQLALARTQAD